MQPSVFAGAGYALLAFTIYVFGDSFMKMAGMYGLPLLSIILISSASGLAVLIAYLILTKRMNQLCPQNRKILLVVTLIYLFSMFPNIVSFTNLPLTTVYIGIFATPFLVAFYGAFFMGEALNAKQIVAIIMGFVGVLIALLPELVQANAAATGNIVLGYIALPFFLLFCTAGQIALRIAGRTETPETITFYSFAGRVVVLLPALWLYPISTFDFSDLLPVFGGGVCGVLGFVLMSMAYKNAPVAIVAPFHYTQLITGAALGYLFWQDVPSVWIGLGGILIVASGLIVGQEARRRDAVAACPK